jgi:hypothetical protein
MGDGSFSSGSEKKRLQQITNQQQQTRVVNATKTLPAGYQLHGSIILTKNVKLWLLLNVLSIPWFCLCAAFFLIVTHLLRPQSPQNLSITITPGLTSFIFFVVGILLTISLPVILHELVHGFFYWLFTKARPTFGVSWWYAYAVAPGWYLPRWQFLVVGMAPLIILSLLGLALLPFVPWIVLPSLVFGLIVNATGAIGDLYMVLRLALTPAGVVIEDRIDGIRWYVPEGKSHGGTAHA